MRGIQDSGTKVDFIVSGYTNKLQVLDVGINKPFKGYIRESYQNFMMGNTNGKMAL